MDVLGFISMARQEQNPTILTMMYDAIELDYKAGKNSHSFYNGVYAYSSINAIAQLLRWYGFKCEMLPNEFIVSWNRPPATNNQ